MSPVGLKLSCFMPLWLLFQIPSALSTLFSCLSRFGRHTCSRHSPASRSEAIDVITKSWCRLFHAKNYFFTKFQKNIKNILSSLLCNVAAAKKFCIGELFNVIRPSRLPIRTNIAPRNTIFPPAPKNIRRQELATGYFHVDSLLSMPTTQRADSRSSWHLHPCGRLLCYPHSRDPAARGRSTLRCMPSCPP